MQSGKNDQKNVFEFRMVHLIVQLINLKNTSRNQMNRHIIDSKFERDYSNPYSVVPT